MIPGWGTKILHATQCSWGKKKNKTVQASSVGKGVGGRPGTLRSVLSPWVSAQPLGHLVRRLLCWGPQAACWHSACSHHSRTPLLHLRLTLPEGSASSLQVAIVSSASASFLCWTFGGKNFRTQGCGILGVQKNFLKKEKEVWAPRKAAGSVGESLEGPLPVPGGCC